MEVGKKKRQNSGSDSVSIGGTKSDSSIQDTDGKKYGVLQMTEDLIRRSTVDNELHIDGSQLDNRIRLIEGLGPAQQQPLSRAMSKGSSGLKAQGNSKDPPLLAGRAQHIAPFWNLRVLSLPGHMIVRMSPISCLRYF